MRTIPRDRNKLHQYLIMAVISAAVLLLMHLQLRTGADPYRYFFGPIPTVPLFFYLIGLGFILTAVITRTTPFSIVNAKTPGGVIQAALSAMAFFLLMTLVDIAEPFPSTINLAPPSGIFFYPSIGFVVEILFHLLPFTLIWIATSRIGPDKDQRTFTLLSMFVVASIEPVFQSLISPASASLAKEIGVFLIIYGINAQSLLLFTRSGFVSMYTLRLVYYLFWHIIWGYFRLNILF
jgi:hypothetical protein